MDPKNYGNENEGKRKRKTKKEKKKKRWKSKDLCPTDSSVRLSTLLFLFSAFMAFIRCVRVFQFPCRKKFRFLQSYSEYDWYYKPLCIFKLACAWGKKLTLRIEKRENMGLKPGKSTRRFIHIPSALSPTMSPKSLGLNFKSDIDEGK